MHRPSLLRSTSNLVPRVHRLHSQRLIARWDQTLTAEPVNSRKEHTAVKRTARAQFQEFPKSFTFKAKVNTVTEKLRFIHHVCIGNLIIVFHWVSQLELFFHSVIFTTSSYKSLTDFRFQLLQSTRQRKPEVALDFVFDGCEGKEFTAVKRKIQRYFRFSLPRSL